MPTLESGEKCPVCGMNVRQQKDKAFNYAGMRYHFCSSVCQDMFSKQPEIYLHMQMQRFHEHAHELELVRKDTLLCLSRAAEFKDVETSLHTVRIGVYSGHLATLYGLSINHARLIHETAPMHDIGKIGVPEYILHKPSRLNQEEREIIEQHPRMGETIIGEDCCSKVMKMAALIAKTHHERWDGKGYPLGLQGQDIPIEGRIVALCDVFDALMSKRPYKQAWAQEKVYALIDSESGQHFDPTLSALFLERFEDFISIQQKLKDRHAGNNDAHS